MTNLIYTTTFLRYLLFHWASPRATDSRVGCTLDVAVLGCESVTFVGELNLVGAAGAVWRRAELVEAVGYCRLLATWTLGGGPGVRRGSARGGTACSGGAHGWIWKLDE